MTGMSPPVSKAQTDVAPALRCRQRNPVAVQMLASLILQLLKTGQGSDLKAT